MNPERLITIKEMIKLIGKKRPTIYKMVKDGRLPRPVMVNNRTQGWTVSQYNEWLDKNGSQAAIDSPSASEILKFRVERFIATVANTGDASECNSSKLLNTYSKVAKRILADIEKQSE